VFLSGVALLMLEVNDFDSKNIEIIPSWGQSWPNRLWYGSFEKESQKKII
jgi:hypothetical protein